MDEFCSASTSVLADALQVGHLALEGGDLDVEALDVLVGRVRRGRGQDCDCDGKQATDHHEPPGASGSGSSS
jgi:hypothetical protein